MATSSASQSNSPLITLEDQKYVLTANDINDILGLECDVCKEDFELIQRPPKMLPCNHSVCLPCLIQMEQNATTNYHSSIGCPMCRSEVNIDEISTLPNDFRLVKGLEKIVKVKETYKNVCFKHNCRILDKFCKVCLLPVCSDCVCLYHNDIDDHIVIDITKAMEENDQRFCELEKKCLESLNEMKKKSVIVENIQDCLDQQESNEGKKILETFDKYTQLLNKRREDIVIQMKVKIDQRKLEMKLESETLNSSIRRLEDLTAKFKISKEINDVVEIFKIQKAFIENEKDWTEILPNEDLCQRCEFKAVNDERFKTHLAVIGDVQTRIDICMLHQDSDED